jgi:hypothetical protein
MRGSKGNKYYQSNKAHKYYDDMFCSQGCFHSWFKTNKDTCMNAVGEIGKKTIGVDDAWEFKHERNYNNERHNEDMYFLINRLQGVHHVITREQAQTPDQIRQDYGWYTRGNSEAKPLAIQLGLAS